MVLLKDFFADDTPKNGEYHTGFIDGRQAGYGETRTFSFGSVTTSVTTGGFQDRSRLQSPMFQDRPAYLPRRR